MFSLKGMGIQESTFLLELSESFVGRYSLLMGHSLVDINRGITQKVRIMNPFPEAKVIF